MLLIRILSLFSFLIICSVNSVHAQEADYDLIQFSGIIVDQDSLVPVPFATVMVKNTNRGTTSDYYGYFSFVAKKGDTIVFSSIGYRSSDFYVSDSLQGSHYSLIHSMVSDTIELETVNIYPWPTPEQFKDAFLALKIPDDDLEIARKNLDPSTLAAKAAVMPMDGSMNFKWENQQRFNQLYYAGQSRMNNLSNLLNPIAWAQFIEAWKRGDFKRQENR
tara:strand:+ start:9444 stop:10100 length:657 start_codon:yes stop_codon:yes gene_type:complete